MNKYRNEHGITLVELLVTLVIGSMIILLITSVIIAFQNHYKQQLDETKALTDISIAAQAITKDLRSSTNIELSNDQQRIIIYQRNKQPITYHFTNNNLFKNDVIYLQHLKEFYVKKENSKIFLTLINQANQKIETTIVLREVKHTHETNK